MYTSGMKTTSSPQADWREYRRRQAVVLSQEGWTVGTIATALGVTHGAVSQWLKAAREGGEDALRHRPPPGPTRKLTDAQRGELATLLDGGAEAAGLQGDYWTLPRIGTVIQRTFGVTYSESHLSRLVRALGFSVQVPERRATQRDEEAIAVWKEERLPTLKKGRSQQARQPVSGWTRVPSTPSRHG